MSIDGLSIVAGLGAVGVLAHATLTASPRFAVGFAIIAVGLAFPAESLVVRTGRLVHGSHPQVRSVAVAALAGWISLTYPSFRVAEWILGASGTTLGTGLLAGLIATTFDGLVDPIGVRRGWWVYPPAPLSRPRVLGVPWWNSLGWFGLSAAVVFLAGTLLPH